MDLDEAREAFIQMVVSAGKLESEIRAMTLRRDGLRKAAIGLSEAFPELRTVDYDLDGRPRGSEAVRLILEEDTQTALDVSGIVDRLRERDWLPKSDNPSNAVRAALERLIASDPKEFGKGRPPHGGPLIYFSRKGSWRNFKSDDTDGEEEPIF